MFMRALIDVVGNGRGGRDEAAEATTPRPPTAMIGLGRELAAADRCDADAANDQRKATDY